MEEKELIRAIFDEKKELLENEDFLHTLIHEKISTNIDDGSANASFGERMSDKLTNAAGSWRFIIGFMVVMAIWIVINVILLQSPFDPYPFILLNLVLSCIAAIQAPIIMMSQNRQDDKDRLRARNDYKVNLKSELIIENLHERLDQLLENQQKIFEKLTEFESKAWK